MKTLIRTPLKALLLVLFTVGMAGCNDLVENPDFLNPEAFYQTSDDLLMGVTGVYDNLGYGTRWFNHFYNRYVFECAVGYQVGWEKGPLAFQTGNIGPTDEYINEYWDLSYESINRANAVLEAAEILPRNNKPDLTERIVGETRFLRAWYYYYLIAYFDDVPVKSERTKGLDYASNADGKRKVLDLMVEDLKAAAQVLPGQYAGADVGRATGWAAKALLMKTYLMDEKWSEARSVAEDIINNSPHYLFDDFSHNFDVLHENSGERIFEAQVSAAANSNEYQNHHAHFVPPDLPTEMGGVGWHWLNGTQAFRENYDPEDKRIPGTFIEQYPSTRVGGSEIRWSSDADYNLSRSGGLVKADADPSNPDELIFSGAFVGKHVEINNNAFTTERNTVYLRYADVLLGHSEAANESGSGDALRGINEVRARAGLLPLSGLSRTALRDAIVEERVREFAFEMEIYPELKRKSTFNGDPDYLGDYIQDFIDRYNVNRTLSQRDYALPIPQDEVLGNPEVQQHPFWR